MNIIIGDDNKKLTDEIQALMHDACCEALGSEFPELFHESGIAAADANAELALSMASEEEIRLLNREYRGIDKVTDVLSFPQYEGSSELKEALLASGDGPAVPIGDVVICYEQAGRQAEEFGTGIKRELLYLFVHSIMHLFGYDHEDEEDKREMRTREEEVLSKLKGLK